MVDAALASPPAPDQADEDWRAGLTRWAVGIRDTYRRHPLVAPGANQRTTARTKQRRLARGRAAHAQQHTTLRTGKLSCILLVSGFVRNDATLTADLAVGADPVMPGYGTVLSRLTNADDFPALHRAIASGALDDEDDINAEFTLGLERILDGIDTLIRANARPR